MSEITQLKRWADALNEIAASRGERIVELEQQLTQARTLLQEATDFIEREWGGPGYADSRSKAFIEKLRHFLEEAR